MSLSPHCFAHEAMATTFEIFVVHASADYARQATAAAFRELDRLEQELSRYVESSDIACANRLTEGESLILGDDTLRCLLIAAEVSAATCGAFDPAYGSPVLRSADTPLFALDPQTHTLTSLTPRLQLDLGAVGKGYALDVMAETLRDWHLTLACLQSGGSTALALDPPPGATGWPIGAGEQVGAISAAQVGPRRPFLLRHQALSGSGLAVKGAHLIDPGTRQPASRQHRAFAFAPTAAIADALSTAFFVLPDAAVEAYCQAHPSTAALLENGTDRPQSFGALPPR